MVNDPQVSVWVIFVRFHYLSASVSHCRGLAICTLQTRAYKAVSLDNATTLFLFCALFEKHLAQNVFFLAKVVVVLHIVVVRLVKHAIRIMVAVRVLVSDTSDLS